MLELRMIIVRYKKLILQITKVRYYLHISLKVIVDFHHCEKIYNVMS